MIRVVAWQITDVCRSHNKYYRAYVSGSRVVFQYGRIGAVQSTTVQDCAHPASAIRVASNKLQTKLSERGKHYVEGDPVFALRVDADVWDNPSTHKLRLAAAYADAEQSRTTLAGSLSDGRGHVVAYVGARHGRGLPATAPTRTHPSIDLTLAALSPAQAATADREVFPRLNLVDLGPVEDGDSEAVLDAALRMWTPATAQPQSNLQVCLENARMIFAPSA